jgi:hypothetical protein
MAAGVALGISLCAVAGTASAQNANVKVTYLWHLHQPIYWNDQTRRSATDRYEYAGESILERASGAAHPQSPLENYFSVEDRIAAYQFRPTDSIGTFEWTPRGGAQLTYSGSLAENVNNLAVTNAIPGRYFAGWNSFLRNGWNKRTSGNKPRLDVVNFSYHHALLPLMPPEVAYMEIRLHQEKMREIMGPGFTVSRGIFPTEMAFSTRLIPIFKALGIEWTIVSGEKIARATPDFPVQLGSGGVNCDPPNRADQINPPGVNFLRETISRGCSPVNANPLSFQINEAQWVDPNTGAVEKILVVPADQAWSWNDGYGCINSSFLGAISERNDPTNPSIVVLAHDGDNAFGGGFSYYMECVPNLMGNLGAGREASTVEQALLDWEGIPNRQRRTVHVEDGAWVNADSDFGSPIFINWLYPLLNAQGQHDPVNGWHEKAREYAIFIAMTNRVLTAQQVTNSTPNFAKIMNPDASTSAVDRGWHYLLGSLDSGNVYYGAPQDFEVLATVGVNEAAQHVDPIVAANLASDTTPPTIFIPQRHPYNPGGVNYGVQYQYRQFIDDGDFHIWTFAYDVNGPVNAVLKYRIDEDGVNPLDSLQNETFAGGPEVGAWVELPMARRSFPAENIYNKPELNYFELPLHIADHFSVEVTGLRSRLIDYYVEATDSRGNVARSPIQHVWIGDGSGSTGGGGSRVAVEPTPPVRGENVTVTYTATGGPLATATAVNLYHGKNNWATVFPQVPMTANGDGTWTASYTVANDATNISMVFNNGAGAWDNNNGQDWYFNTVAGTGPTPTPTPSPTPDPNANPFEMDGSIDAEACQIGVGLWVAERDGWLYVASNVAGDADAFIYITAEPSFLGPANWGKAGQVPRWDYFLAREGTNSFASWFSSTQAVLADQPASFVKFRSGAITEGAIRKSLVGGNIAYVALGVFETADGGALTAQAPPAVTANGNIEANEMLAVITGGDVCTGATPTPTPAPTVIPTASPSPTPLPSPSPVSAGWIISDSK